MDKEEHPVIKNIKRVFKNINNGSIFKSVIEYMLVLLKPGIEHPFNCFSFDKM